MLIIGGKQVTLKKIEIFLRFKVNSLINHFRKTKVPFKKGLVKKIDNAIQHTSEKCDKRIFYRIPVSFPEIAELQLYWGLYKNITRIFSKSNKADPYYDWRRIYTQIVKENRLVVKDLFEMWFVQHYQPKRILEIGSRTGKSLVSKMLFHSDIDKTLICCIDPFIEQGSHGNIRNKIRHLGAASAGLVVIVGFSEEIIPEIKKRWSDLKFDYILVDGSHRPEDAYKDLCMSVELLNPGGIVCFDDLGPSGHQLLPVWELWKENYGKSFITKEYYIPYGFAVAQKCDIK